MIRHFCWAAAVIAIISPPIDSFLDASMSRHMLLQMPLLVGMGFAAAWLWPAARLRTSSMRVSAIIFAIGSLLFWMLPRSLDTAVTVAWADQAMHANMLVVGWSLAVSLPRLPFQAKVSLGIYGLAMALAAGAIYASAVVPVCSTYSVQQQNEAGTLLLWIGATLFFVLLGRGAFLLGSLTHVHRSH